MRYCRFLHQRRIHYGAVEDRDGELWIADLIAAPEEDLGFRAIHGRSTLSPFSFKPTLLSHAELLAPVTPSKIVCVGRNYRDHAKELGMRPAEPLLFFKPPSSLLSPGGAVRMPAVSQRVDYEGEFALVIGGAQQTQERGTWRKRYADIRWPTTLPHATYRRKTVNGHARRALDYVCRWGRW